MFGEMPARRAPCIGARLMFVFLSAQRLGGLSYFAGAEKKDDRVLVPDLGSLTSIHDRWVGWIGLEQCQTCFHHIWWLGV